METLWGLSGDSLGLSWDSTRETAGFAFVLQAFFAVADRQTAARQPRSVPKESSEERKSLFFISFTSISARDGSWETRGTAARHPRHSRQTPAAQLPDTRGTAARQQKKNPRRGSL